MIHESKKSNNLTGIHTRKKTICHISSVHTRNDTRIFIKECCSLVKAGYNVSLIIADGKGNEHREGVHIYDVGAFKGRINRIRNATKCVFSKAVTMNADIYHLHDPELIPYGLNLKRLGKTVIFDSHEDVPKQFINKHYLNRPTRWLIAKIFAAYETWACKRFDVIVTPTPFISKKFLTINPRTIEISNFPIIGELAAATSWYDKHRVICYVGGINANRGIREIVTAMSMTNSSVRLNIGGEFEDKEIESEAKEHLGWTKVDALGYLKRDGVRDLLSRSIAGLVTLHPIVNYLDALPTKMFEYMSAGIPVIASNFPLWRKIIEGNDCGICVDPLHPSEISSAIDFIVNNQERARQMGENGRIAVQNLYNWPIEERKLINLYQSL